MHTNFYEFICLSLFLQLNLTQQFKLPGQQKSWFGLSVENIGDTDRDGFDDIAVGAPFRDNGAVYIFRGTQEGLMLDDYQVGMVC